MALVALAVCTVTLDSNAWFGRRRQSGCCPRVERVCERPCAVKVKCPTYEIVETCEEAPTCAPKCCRYVKVEEPAVLHKNVTYNWSCPPTCDTDGQEDHTQIKIVDKQDGTSKKIYVAGAEDMDDLN